MYFCYQTVLILALCFRNAFSVINGIAPLDKTGQAIVFIDNGVESAREHRYCTGFLISRWHVITVAICGLKKTARTRVRIGSKWAFDFGETHAVEQVRQIYGHSVNDKDDPYWRICVMKLNRPITNRETVSFLILPRLNDHRRSNQNLDGIGFGSNREDVLEASNQLLSVSLPLVQNYYCDRAYSEPLTKNPRDTSKFLCYGFTNNKRKLVRFDSGAPLVDNNGIVWGVALTSIDLGKSDNDFYPIFAANVSSLRGEINEAMKHLDGILD